ncbi:MAG: hypothetical protein GWN00_27415 [Aliifodinibius sp.]|nr:hypothetical protein [Fodinibius sp.]NIV14550.1 hypothetical protein [Fodinibius sp.]NIY28396.1 hypothetical protein [Fodinibius sp.]
MDENWLEIPNENIDVAEIKRQVQARLAKRRETSVAVAKDPAAIARELWLEIIGDPLEEMEQGKSILLTQRDCDIVPRHYVIDWQIPLLGPINALLRRLINAEIRRFLLPSLERQSFLNRQLLQALRDVAEENRCLRQEIENLRNERK